MAAADVIQRQLDAYNNRDVEAFVACYALDAVVLGPDGDTLLADRTAIEERYRELFAQSPELRAEVLTRIESGDWVVDEESVSGLVTPGLPSDMHAAVVYRVRDGLIAQAQMLF